MRWLAATLTIAVSIALPNLSWGQGAQNSDLRDVASKTSEIEGLISRYLNGPEIRSVLTPGEVSSFPLSLKVGQVVFGEASSDAFDPALEIVDPAGKVMAYNDDRYPGDQRPLLFWRCDKEGAYSLRVRCFHDKSGGQFSFRYNVYDSIDLAKGQKVEKEIDAHVPILLRVSMKAGENLDVHFDNGGEKHYLNMTFNDWISPIGLPNYWLPTIKLQPAVFSFMAPVSGDYYAMESPSGTDAPRGLMRAWIQEYTPVNLPLMNGTGEAKAPTREATIWKMHVRKGDLVEFNTPELNPNCSLALIEAPDISKCDLSKPETNPFFPNPPDPANDKGPVVVGVEKRPNDFRYYVYYILRDADVWVGSNGDGPADKQYTLRVRPAAEPFVEEKVNSGKLTIVSTDFWSFDAKAGDVLTLNTKSDSFAESIIVQDPQMRIIHRYEAGLDQTSASWRMVTQVPGRYLVHVKCVGNGGGGPYTLSRIVHHAKEFGIGTPARGEISKGEVQVWRFTVKPEAPLLIHWNSNDWSYNVNIYNEKGNRADFQRQDIDSLNKLGILKVDKPQTFVIVLSGGEKRAEYSIDLSPIPSYKKGGR